MSGINFNARTVAPNVGIVPVPKGSYTVFVTHSEKKPTSNGAGTIIEFRNQINGGEMHGRNIMFNINWENQNAKAVEIGHGQLSALCWATGVLDLQDTQQLHNIPYQLDVDVTPDGKYNEVKGINPVTQASAPMTQATPAPVQQYQQPAQVAPAQMQQQQPVNSGMAQYEAMTQPQPAQMQMQPQPVQQVQPQQVQAAPGAVPDWIANQQAMQAQGQPMGNG